MRPPSVLIILTITFLVILTVTMLTGCNGAAKFSIVDATSIDKSQKQTFSFNVPVKQQLQPFKWDYPRSLTKSTIANKQKCIEAVKKRKLDPNADYLTEDLSWLKPYCIVPAIDRDSNLFIGLTESDFKTLSNNFTILMTREKRWIKLLDGINKLLADDSSKDKPTDQKEIKTKDK